MGRRFCGGIFATIKELGQPERRITSMLRPFYGTKDLTFALAHHCAMKSPSSVQLALFTDKSPTCEPIRNHIYQNHTL